MKASVLENGSYDQKVGKNDNEADRHAKSDNHIVTSAPVVADVLSTFLIKKLDRLVVVALFWVVSRHCHVEISGGFVGSKRS